MNTHLRSQNISLQFTANFGEYNSGPSVNELWLRLRGSAVEPGQSSSPDLLSFADDCLLCTHIVTNAREPAAPAANDNAPLDESLWDPEEPPEDTSAMPQPTPSETVGLIYLHSGPANVAGGEANIGVITRPDVQGRGYAREAVLLVLRWAFEELKFHRIQAAILDTPSKDRALRLFIGSGFAHEGTKRRSVYQPEGEGMAGTWKNVTYLAMLDTEWVLKYSTWGMRSHPQPPIVSVWDEMFARHAREREELVRWEENHGRIRKTSSSETLRDRARNSAIQDIAYLTDDASSVTTSSPPSPKPNLIVNWEDDVYMVEDQDLNEPRQSWEEVVETSFAARRQRQWRENASLDSSLHGHMLALPSIPSRLSEGFPQSPLTISTPSTPGATPPPISPSPSPAPPSVRSTWIGAEDEHDRLLREDPFATPHPSAGPSSLRTRSRSSSVSSSSTDDWSDAQSSVGGSSSWEIVSNTSDRA